MSFDFYVGEHGHFVAESGGEIVHMAVVHPDECRPGEAAYRVDASTVAPGARAASNYRIGTFEKECGFAWLGPGADRGHAHWRAVRLIERGRTWVTGPKTGTVDGWSKHW